MGVAKPEKRFTPQEYYRLEEDAVYKSDFYDGEIFAMAGGTVRHSRIRTNIVREAGTRFEGNAMHGVRIEPSPEIKATGLRTYPDVSVYCGPLEYDEEDPTGQTVTNPTVLFEVLSKTTEGYDRGFKSENYRQIASLKAYVLVAQNQPYVEIYERQGDRSWRLRDARGMEAVLRIDAILIDLPLADVYDRVNFKMAE